MKRLGRNYFFNSANLFGSTNHSKGTEYHMIIGYARISTQHQKFDSQINSLERFGCDTIFTECSSGRKTERPELNKVLKKLKSGDTLVIYKLDRLSRGTKHLLQLMEDFERKEIHFVSIQNNIDTSTSMGKFFFTVMSAFAEMEADLIRERVLSGLDTAKENGVRLGRPRKKIDVNKIVALYTIDNKSVSDIAKIMNLSRPTIYKHLKEQKIINKKI
jgi:DNA invertase Pin-like site-specific DNA recombinase